MIHNKLVHDKIPKILIEKGIVPISHIAKEENEYWKKLQQKLQEEVTEFLEDNNEEGLADILEVIHAICIYKKYDLKNVEKIRQEKAQKRGAFEKRIILEETH